MFQMVTRHWDVVFFPLTTPKGDLGEVEKAMFQVLACHFELTLEAFTFQNTTLLKLRKDDSMA